MIVINFNKFIYDFFNFIITYYYYVIISLILLLYIKEDLLENLIETPHLGKKENF